MFRFYNTTKTRGPGQAPPQRRPWRSWMPAMALLALSPLAANAQSATVINDFSSPINSSVWTVDRYQPAAFQSQVNFLGNNRLLLKIDSTGSMKYRSATYSSTFNNTQGKQRALPNGVIELSVDMFIPDSFATMNKRVAGLWGVSVDAADAVIGYPIIEFASDSIAGQGATPQPRFQFWDNNNGFDNPLLISNIPGFTYNSWHNLKIKLNASHDFEYYVDNQLVSTTTDPSTETSVRLSSAILQGYNYNPNLPLDSQNNGVNYSVYFDNLTVAPGLINVEGAVTSSTSASLCSGQVAGINITVTPSSGGTFSGSFTNGKTFSNLSPVAGIISPSYTFTNNTLNPLNEQWVLASLEYKETATGQITSASQLSGQTSITVYPVSNINATYSGSSEFCGSGKVTISVSNPNSVGGTYNRQTILNGAIHTATTLASGQSYGTFQDSLINTTQFPAEVLYVFTPISPANGCSGDADTIKITVNPIPALASVVADTVCEGNITTITLNGLNPNMDYDIEGTINGNFDNNGTSGTFSFPGMTGSFTADASGNHSFSYPTVYGDSVVTDYTAQVTKLTYSATGCSIDYTDSNKIGTGVVHPIPKDVLVVNSSQLVNNQTATVCEGSTVTLGVTGDTANTYSLYRVNNSTLVVPPGHVGDSTYSFTAQLSDSGVYYLHLMSPYGCEVVDTIHLTVNPLPVFTLTQNTASMADGDTLTYCEGSAINLMLSGSATDSFSMMHGTVSVGNGLIGSGVPHNFNAALSDAGDYELSVTTANGCSVTNNFTLTVNPLPTDHLWINGMSMANNGMKEVCEGSVVTVSTHGDSTNTYTLYRGDHSTVVATGNVGDSTYSFTARLSDDGQYFLHLESPSGCSTEDTLALGVNPLPVFILTQNTASMADGDTLTYCEGSAINLMLSGSATDSFSMMHGSVSVGSGLIGSGVPHNFNAALSDAGNYELTVMTTNGCSVTNNFELVVNPLPTDVFTVNTSVVDNGDTVTFCENSPVTLTLTGNSADSFALYHGVALVGAGMSNGPAYNFNANVSDAGTYYMHLISEHGCETVDTIEMVVNSLPVATFTFNTNPLMNGDTAIACVESPVTLELTGNSTDSYVLLHGTDTVAIGNPNDPAFPFNAAMSDAGTYYLHLTSQHGCSIVDTFNLNVIAKPAFAWSFNGFPATANDSATAINYCASDTLALGLNIDSNYTFTIALDGSMAPAMPGVDTTVAVPMSFVTPGIHSIQLTVTNQNGCDSSMTVYINVHGLPIFAANTITNVHCHGGTDGSFGFVVLNNDSTTANYTFNIINVNGNDTVYTLNVNSLAPTSPIIVAGTQSNLGAGTYQVVVSNSFGCATIDTVTISEPPALSLAMTSQDVTCGAVTPNGKIQVQPTGGVPMMGMYQLTVSGPGLNNAQYYAPGGSVYTINHLSAGVYTLTLADSNGCSISQTDTIMKPSANVVTSVNGPDTVNMNASASVILSATGAALPVTYTYTVNGGTPQTATSSASSADVTLTVPTNSAGTVGYAITAVTDANGAPCSPVLGSGTVEVVNQAVVDLVPGVDITNGSLSPQYNTSDITISLYNIGNHASNGTITVFVSKPSTNISLDFSGATGWNVTLAGSFYVLTSTSLSVNGNYGVLQIPGTATLSGSGQVGSKFIKVTIPANSGGDSNSSNNSFTGFVNVNQ